MSQFKCVSVARTNRVSYRARSTDFKQFVSLITLLASIDTTKSINPAGELQSFYRTVLAGEFIFSIARTVISSCESTLFTLMKLSTDFSFSFKPRSKIDCLEMNPKDTAK